MIKIALSKYTLYFYFHLGAQFWRLAFKSLFHHHFISKHEWKIF